MLLFIFSVFMFSHLVIITTSNIHENFAISCGASGNSPAPDGRIWVRDASLNSSLLQLRGKSTMSRVLHQAGLLDLPAPYKSARTSHHEFTYQFSVKPGQKFIRLHFRPASYKGFKKSKAIFTVKSGQHTLLSDFIPTLAATPTGINYVKKEFCINVQESETLNITFTPSRKPSFSGETYAFVNAIEIVSMPAGLYFTPDGDLGVRVVGRKHRFYIDNCTALETIQRINAGGNSISSLEDGAMFREWEDDSNYLRQVGSFSIKRPIPISFPSSATDIAPKEIFQSARSMGTHCHSDVCNLVWNIPLDLGFRYLVRLHFCEIDPGVMDEGERKFSITINNQKAEDEADVIKWSGGHGISVHRDYVTIMEGDRREHKRNLSLVLKPMFEANHKHLNAILNGLEVFKLSNPDNNLGSMSPPHPVTSSTPKKSVPFATKNTIATLLTVTATLINVVVYYIRYISETNSGKANNGQSSTEHQCRQFSLDELLRSTNSFDPQLLIGTGGFGKVYKGVIDGVTTVAVKRLKSESIQGEKEFWTEIKMLSTLRYKHLLSLVGYCNEGKEMLLVYDYMPRGSLADHLFKMDRSGHNNSSLPWEQRIKIAIGAARGLNFLHTSQNRVIHRDVKSSNILLDENWVSKISDFGLSKMGPGNESATHVSTQVKGTFGYLDPEYFLTNRLTWKTDVYAFGVVLFEVLSGRPAVNMKLDEEQHGLAAWAKRCITKGEVNKLIDLNLAGHISPTSLEAFAVIAEKCLDDHPHQRPAMSEVVKGLESARVLQQNAGYFLGESTSPLKVEKESTSTKEQQGVSDHTAKRITSSRTKVKSKDKKFSNATSLRWWDFLGLFPKAPPRTKASPAAQPEQLQHFSLHEILKAAKDFHGSPKIVYLGAAKAYVGFINGRSIFIRRSSTAKSRFDMDSELQAMTEGNSIARHTNMVSLIGFCRNYFEMILVYDYAARGTLRDYLRDPQKERLPWKRRLQICIGAAEGLKYLQSILKITVHHLVFNSSYILLDENWVAKVSFAGCVKSEDINKFGEYLDSDYIRDERMTEKSYVYSFGLVLFEMICSSEALDHWLNHNQVSLAHWIRTCFMNNIAHWIDPYLDERISPDCSAVFVNTAVSCLHNEGNKRPSLSDLIMSLQEALKLQEAAERDVSGAVAGGLSFNPQSHTTQQNFFLTGPLRTP